MIHRKRLWLGAGLVGLAVAAGWVGNTLRNASHAVEESRAGLAAKDTIRFNSARLDRHPRAGFEPLQAPAKFSDVAFFQGHIFLCGPGGLTEYDSDGAVVARFRTGAELPAAPLVRMHTGVAADAQGEELYIATGGEGLLAFDGRTFRQIRPEEAGLRKLTTLLTGTDGRIVIGTAKNGLLVYDGKRLTPLLPGIAVTALGGSETDLWVGTLDQGLLHMVAGRLERIADTPDARVNAIEVVNGGVFAATPLGVADIRNGRVERVLAQGSFAQAVLLSKRTLLVGTLQDGTLEVPIEAQVNRISPRVSERASGSVKRLIQSGNRVYELREDGLYLNGEMALTREPSMLTDNNISAVSPDAAGRLWIGYFDRGLDIADLNSHGPTHHIEDDAVYCVNRIVHDVEKRHTGVATANGFVMFDDQGRERQVLTRRDGLIATHVTDALLARDGSWTLATPAGLTFLDNGRASSIYAMQGLVNNHVYSLGECGSRIVAGTLGGASVLDKGLVKASFTTANSPLKQNWISAVVPVTNGCFVGTYGAGVFAFESANGEWRAFSDMKAGVVVNPNAMAVTSQAVYAGTLGKGLAVFNFSNRRWSWIVDGLPSLNVTALAVEGNVLYVGTDNGLVRVSEAELVRTR